MRFSVLILDEPTVGLDPLQILHLSGRWQPSQFIGLGWGIQENPQIMVSPALFSILDDWGLTGIDKTQVNAPMKL